MRTTGLTGLAGLAVTLALGLNSPQKAEAANKGGFVISINAGGFHVTVGQSQGYGYQPTYQPVYQPAYQPYYAPAAPTYGYAAPAYPAYGYSVPTYTQPSGGFTNRPQWNHSRPGQHGSRPGRPIVTRPWRRR